MDYTEKELIEYEAEIDRMIDFLVREEEKEKNYRILKQILRNYDKMVKSNNNALKSYKMPYWTVGCFMGNEKESNNEKI